MATATAWALMPEVWVILGVLLVITEIFLGTAHVVLSVGLSAFAISGLLYGQEQGWFDTRVLLDTWRSTLVWFAILSVVMIVLVRIFARSSKKGDVNTY